MTYAFFPTSSKMRKRNYVFSKDGTTDKDIRSRINKARHVSTPFDKSGDRYPFQSAIRSGFSTLLLRDVANERYHHPKAAFLHEPMPRKYLEH